MSIVSGTKDDNARNELEKQPETRRGEGQPAATRLMGEGRDAKV
jgi:hypothetical protein